jgi:hypothetical protein
MSKLKAVAVLSGLISCVLLILSSLAVEGKPKGPPGNPLASLHGALTSACQSRAEESGDDEAEAHVLFRACKLVLGALAKAASTSPEDLAQAVGARFDKVVHFRVPCPEGQECVVPRDPCARCIQAVSDFETFISTNATTADLQAALEAACAERLSDPAQLGQCAQVVSDLPPVIDDAVANFPPLTVCQARKACKK